MIDDNEDLKELFKKVMKNPDNEKVEEEFQRLFEKKDFSSLSQIKTAISHFLAKPSQENVDTFTKEMEKLFEKYAWANEGADDRYRFLYLVLGLVSRDILTISQLLFLYEYTNKIEEEYSEIAKKAGFYPENTEINEKLTSLSIKRVLFKTWLTAMPVHKSVFSIINPYLPENILHIIPNTHKRKVLASKDLHEKTEKLNDRKDNFIKKGEFLDEQKIEKFITDMDSLLKEFANRVSSHFIADKAASGTINSQISELQGSLNKLKAPLLQTLKKAKVIDEINMLLKISQTQTHAVTQIKMFGNKEKLPVCLLYVKDKQTAEAAVQCLHEKGIGSRNNPLLMKTIQQNKKTEQYFISLTGAQFDLLKCCTGARDSFSDDKIKEIKTYISKLEEDQHKQAKNNNLFNKISITLSNLVAKSRGLRHHHTRDEKMNAFSLLLRLSELGYPRQAILDYIKADYTHAINNGDGKILFEKLQQVQTKSVGVEEKKISNN